MMSISRRASLEQHRNQQEQHAKSTANDDAITMSSLEILSQGARLMAGLGSRLIGGSHAAGKTEEPAAPEPAKPPSPPQPTYNPGGWREEWNGAAGEKPSSPSRVPARKPTSGSESRYARSYTRTSRTTTARTEKEVPKPRVSPPSSANTPSVVSSSHYTSSHYSADSSASSKPPSTLSPQPCHCKELPPNLPASTGVVDNCRQMHGSPVAGPGPRPTPGPRPGPPAAPSTSIASSVRRTGLSTVRYAERPDVAVQQAVRVFVPHGSAATSLGVPSASPAGPVPYPGRHPRAPTTSHNQNALGRPNVARTQIQHGQNPPQMGIPARSEPAPKPHYSPATLVVYDADDGSEFSDVGVKKWGVPVPAQTARPSPKPNPNPPSPNSAASAVSVLRNAQRAQKTQPTRQTEEKPDTGAELAIGTGLGLGILEKEQPKVEKPVKEQVGVEVRIPGAFVSEVE